MRTSAALRRGNRNAGNFQIHGTEMGAAGEVKRSPVIAAERDVGGRRLPVHDAAELLALRVEDPDAARAAAVDVPGRVDLHAVGHAGLAAAIAYCCANSAAISGSRSSLF